jgi:hypothetical protein
MVAVLKGVEALSAGKKKSEDACDQGGCWKTSGDSSAKQSTATVNDSLVRCRRVSLTTIPFRRMVNGARPGGFKCHERHEGWGNLCLE